MTTDDEPNDNNASGGQIDARGSQGFLIQPSGPVYQNFGETNIHIPLPQPALHQLRAPVGDFVGREREIDQLVQALSKAATSGTAAAISGVRGMGGIGKTELAYVVANRLKDSFPDAQLVVELRGASSSPLTPEQALQTIIRAFEREAKLPDDLGKLKGVYNSMLAGKRALILADDAKDAAQVRSLLPPQGCALLVTSRNRFGLPGMVALDLGTLSPKEAEKLLLEICPRIGKHAAELARLCGYLPLALRVSAGLLTDNDSRNVTHYLEQLRVERLKHLSDPDNPNDSQASVEASLRLSYDALDLASQSALCQLSVFPAAFDPVMIEITVLIDCDISNTVEILQRRSLLNWDAAVKLYNIHDLTRDFCLIRLSNITDVYNRILHRMIPKSSDYDEQVKRASHLSSSEVNIIISSLFAMMGENERDLKKKVAKIITTASNRRRRHY